MKGVGEKLNKFQVVGVKPGFNDPEENEVSAFEILTEESFEGNWKIIYYYPKDFTFVCPTEIVAFSNLQKEFEARGAVVMGGSTDNEFCKLAWRRAHPDLSRLNHWSFADTGPRGADQDGDSAALAKFGIDLSSFPAGNLIDQLGVRDPVQGVALRATYIVDPWNTIQHVSVNNLNIGRNPEETLRILDALQTGGLCGCNREVGGCTL